MNKRQMWTSFRRRGREGGKEAGRKSNIGSVESGAGLGPLEGLLCSPPVDHG